MNLRKIDRKCNYRCIKANNEKKERYFCPMFPPQAADAADGRAAGHPADDDDVLVVAQAEVYTKLIIGRNIEMLS